MGEEADPRAGEAAFRVIHSHRESGLTLVSYFGTCLQISHQPLKRLPIGVVLLPPPEIQFLPKTPSGGGEGKCGILSELGCPRPILRELLPSPILEAQRWCFLRTTKKTNGFRKDCWGRGLKCRPLPQTPSPARRYENAFMTAETVSKEFVS